MTTPDNTTLIQGGKTVTLGSKQHFIPKLKWGPENQWRLRANEYISRLPAYADMLASLTPQEILSNQKAVKQTVAAQGETPAKPIEVNLSKMIQQAVTTLTMYPDTALEFVRLYCPELNSPENVADMNENGDSDQVIVAFMEVMKMAYPFFKELASLAKIGRKL